MQLLVLMEVTFFVVFFSLQRLRCYFTEFIISTVLSWWKIGYELAVRIENALASSTKVFAFSLRRLGGVVSAVFVFELNVWPIFVFTYWGRLANLRGKFRYF